MSILSNQDILNGQPLDATCLEGKVSILSGRASELGKVWHIAIAGDEPGIVLNPDLFADGPLFTDQGKVSLLKKTWHTLFKPDASAELAKVRAEYFPGEATEDFLAQRRIFGMGSFVFLQLDDGIFCAMVQRQAPQGDMTGAVAIGKYSRAAGAADGDLIDCQTWELGEELYALIDRGTSFELMVFKPEPDRTSAGSAEKILAHKEQRIHEILNDPNLSENPLVKAYQLGKPVNTVVHPYRLLEVAELVKDIAVSMPDGSQREFKGYVVDDTKNGDLNIDQAGVVQLPGVTSAMLTLFDDEMKHHRRPWLLFRPEELCAALADKSMEFSPAPAQIIRHMPEFLNELTRDEPSFRVLPAASHPQPR